MREISIEDIQQKYEGSVVMFEKRPVLFKKIGRDYTCRIYDLMAQKEEQAEFSMKSFLPPAPRIGMVNIGGSVVYAVRNAVRRYKLGISRENLSVQALAVEYPDGRAANYIQNVLSLERKELGEALLNKYPSLREAVRRVSQFEGACAFDKQFAVDSHKTIFYKTQAVGLLLNGKDIVFDKGWEHLNILLNKGYEKSY
ncbi:hypothetical protein WT58_24035 [Burkholderia territorii]|uniref:hypothetical protein n=1 Tax=Burkholderia territorii TaxID=1503055 RepID=UPI00075B0275|nr:hypothetical protein [Burkholderia territorii]KWH03707.1 hypothetical protein WT58_24035 [Burkholderia territorii]